jgi:hypothetical protein
MTDTLFSYIERLHGGAEWGTLLDAGTGQKSLDWITSLDTRSWTAVTGEAAVAERLTTEFEKQIRPRDRIVSGNWTDPALLYGDRFDVVLADYLLGAIAGFAPYFQDRLFTRLRPLVGSSLYAIGLAPYPQNAENPWAEVLLEIVRLRDACILLGGRRPYLEYPVDWVLRSLEGSGFVVEEVEKFPIRYGTRFVQEQLNAAGSVLPRLADRALAQQLEYAIAELRDRALSCHAAMGSQPFGEDWIVLARPKIQHDHAYIQGDT